MLCSFIIWTACAGTFHKTHNVGAGHTVIAMIYIYYVFYDMAWSGMLIGYSAEILPYKIRAKGLTVMFLMVDIALFFNQYVNPIALKKLDWKVSFAVDRLLVVTVIDISIVLHRLLLLAGRRAHCCLLLIRGDSLHASGGDCKYNGTVRLL